MTTYIVEIDTDSDALKQLHSIGECGNPKVLTDIIIVETDKSKDNLLSIEGVLSVEEDEFLEPDYIQPDPLSWYLPHASNTEDDYVYERTGEGIDIVVVDTGVRLDHEEFNNPVTLWSFDGKDYDKDNAVSPAHGTSCASCAVGKNFGIAKKASLYNVRKDFKISTDVKAFEKIIQHHQSTDRNTVVSMSYSGKYPINRKLYQRAYEHGLCLIASAGNKGEDTPRYPAAYDNVLSVGSLDRRGNIPSFSNRGADIYAGGSVGYAADIDSPTDKTVFSGTSASCPLVAGMAAMILQGSDKITDSDGVDWLYNTVLFQARERDIGKVINTNIDNEPYKKPEQKPEPRPKEKDDGREKYIIGGVILLTVLAIFLFNYV